MALYVYIKAPPRGLKNEEASVLENFLSKISWLMLFSGVVSILFVAYPLLSYKVKFSLRHNQEKMLAPIPQSLIVSPETRISQDSRVLASETESLSPRVDLEKVENWFPSAAVHEKRLSKITDYTISIPQLGIEGARVKIGGEELKENLVQYGGTALPGEYGNTVIFGHSVLPQFFNPKNYKTIFSTLPEIERGDEIIVDFDGIRFVYIVESYFEIEPSEVEVLEQRFDRQALTLITCVPPGTYWKRGVVTAYLQKI